MAKTNDPTSSDVLLIYKTLTTTKYFGFYHEAEETSRLTCRLNLMPSRYVAYV